MTTFRRRTFPEVLDNLLTAITGGVSAEAHPFPPPGDGLRHSLQQPPAADVISVYGSRDEQPHLFRKDSDYKLLSDKRTLEWQEGAELPDPGSVVLVNYYPTSVQPVLTDLYVGSVTRTLAEAVALEMARLYAQLEVVYKSGFIDTATGSALDKVVALLGVERVKGGFPVGEVEFTRAPNSTGTITIPAGTRVMTADGNVEYATAAEVTLPAGQNTIRVAARDLEINDPLPANQLNVLPVPIVGVAGVTNPAPTEIDSEDESDDELRARAKGFLHGSERATLGAIKHAITRQGVTADVEEDETTPGIVKVTLHADVMPPELAQRIKAAIDDARPAGVKIQQMTPIPPAKVNLELRLVTATGLLEADARAAQRAVRDKISDYFAKLPVREAGSVNKIVGLVLNTPGVEDVRLLSATVGGTDVLDVSAGVLDIADTPTVLGDLRIADPNLPTLLTVTVTFPEDELPPDSAAIQTALNAALAAINTLNASELPASPTPADLQARTLSYGKFLHIIPLPGKAAGTLETFNPAAAPPDVTPYEVTFALVLESGLSYLFSADTADETYQLTPFERVSLTGVELQAEATA